MYIYINKCVAKLYKIHQAQAYNLRIHHESKNMALSAEMRIETFILYFTYTGSYEQKTMDCELDNSQQFKQ